MTRVQRFAPALTIALLVLSMPAAGQWLKTPTLGIPRTADGKPNLDAPVPRTAEGTPDLSGIWRAEPGGYALDLVSDLKPADVMPWADALFRQRSEEFGKDHPGYRCMPDIGPLASFGFFKIMQTRPVMALLPEGGPFRQILTDGRSLPDDPQPTWMGYSVGRWDGDAFIVETAGFNDKTWLDFGGHPHTELLRVTERYRRPDFGHLRIEMTFEDRKAYARPWTVAFEATYAADTELLENVCNENEKSLRHFVVTDEDRRKSRAVVKIAPGVLSRYVGAYEGTLPSGRKQTFEVRFNGVQLSAAPAGAGGFVLIPETATTFTASGTPVIFHVDANGNAIDFVVHTVEGNQVYKKIK